MNTYTFVVTIPNVPDSPTYSPEFVEEWLHREISHPYDAAYEADVTVEYVKGCTPELANPEREGNGAMIYQVPPNKGV